MKRKLWSPVALSAAMIASSATASASAESPLPCLGGRRAALVQGHFSGAIVCSRRDASFVLVGRTTGKEFYVYDYRYRFRPTHANVRHGGQKIVVFRNNVYVGQYALSPPPYVTVTVTGSYVSLSTAGTPKVKLDLTRKPPDHMLFDGEVEAFSR
jgi:hypothetical protein